MNTYATRGKLAVTLALVFSLGCASTSKPPVASVVLRSKLDKKIVALNVDLRDKQLAQVAAKIAQGALEGNVAIAAAMAEEGAPYTHWEIFRGESDDIDKFVRSLRRLSPARCGLVDKPAETAICARAVVSLNQVPTRGDTGEGFRIQGAAQGSATVEQVLVMSPSGDLVSAELMRSERSFETTITPAQGEGLYTVEVLARTGRGLESAARWWLRVGSAELPPEKSYAAEPAEAATDGLLRRAFERLNQDRKAAGIKPVKHSPALGKVAGERVAKYAAHGALSPPNPEKLAKMRVEGDRALARYTETLADGRSFDAMLAEIMTSPAKRRAHLDPGVTAGAVAVARGRSGDDRIYLIEVTGRSYNPNDPGELRDAIVDRVNQTRALKGIALVKDHKPLHRYAQGIAERNLKRNDFLDKDELGRTVSDAIIGDLEGMEFAGSEMFRVNGVEEVTPGATPTDKRFTLIGVGTARKRADMWWVVILVATPE